MKKILSLLTIVSVLGLSTQAIAETAAQHKAKEQIARSKYCTAEMKKAHTPEKWQSNFMRDCQAHKGAWEHK
jgi:hypothetical protein